MSTEEVMQKRVAQYLAKAKPQSVPEKNYHEYKAKFVRINMRESPTGLPGEILPMVDITLYELEERMENEPSCQLSLFLLEDLFDLQYVRYTDYEQFHFSPSHYKAMREYFPFYNRQILVKVQRLSSHWFYGTLAKWALKQEPVEAPWQIHKICRRTPLLSRKGLRFYLTPHGILGSNTHFMEDRSKAVRMSVYLPDKSDDMFCTSDPLEDAEDEY